jgi:hypothetical protein
VGTPDIQWQLQCSWAGLEHALIYRGEFNGKGLQMEIVTGNWGKGESKIAYFIDGDDRQFDTSEGLFNALGFDETLKSMKCPNCKRKFYVVGHDKENTKVCPFCLTIHPKGDNDGK